MKHRGFTGKLFRSCLAALAALLWAAPLWAFAIGTFNIEYFTVTGKRAYTHDHCAHLARTIAHSGADVVALQEIHDDAAMRYFTLRHLQGWQFAGNDTGGRQDLYFLWNPQKAKLLEGPYVYYANASMKYQGKSYRLFDRPVLAVKMMDLENNRAYTLLNVHLKSQSTRGKKDRQAAERYNDFKRAAQIQKLNELVKTIKGPVFILGDYNTSAPRGTIFPLLGLGEGQYSYDNGRSNLDFIGYWNVQPGPGWQLLEVETAIPERSTKRAQHPDHDMVLLDLDGRL